MSEEHKITVLPFDERDFNDARWIAFRIGMGDNCAYTTQSDLGPGLYGCGSKKGAILKTKEFGWAFFQDLNDLGLHDVAQKIGGKSE